ncbi:MAG: sulfite exporter TauE/SafE family protein, partial [Candidatus Rokuibacteriota bacterium]
MQSVVLVLLGGVIGAYGTLIGAGGGFLLVPLLLFMDPLSSPSAVTGISLSIVAANALSGSLAYARKRRIDYHVAIALGLASIPGTVIGALLT